MVFVIFNFPCKEKKELKKCFLSFRNGKCRRVGLCTCTCVERRRRNNIDHILIVHYILHVILLCQLGKALKTFSPDTICELCQEEEDEKKITEGRQHNFIITVQKVVFHQRQRQPGLDWQCKASTLKRTLADMITVLGIGWLWLQ